MTDVGVKYDRFLVTSVMGKGVWESRSRGVRESGSWLFNFQRSVRHCPRTPLRAREAGLGRGGYARSNGKPRFHLNCSGGAQNLLGRGRGAGLGSGSKDVG